MKSSDVSSSVDAIGLIEKLSESIVMPLKCAQCKIVISKIAIISQSGEIELSMMRLMSVDMIQN